MTIVLPTRNGERFLKESLESCLTQTLEDLEVVAVDDGSTDGTQGILAEFAARDERVRVLTQAASLGLPGALNAGFAVARGGLMTWTSDDNIYRPSALRRLSDLLVEHSDVDVVYADCTVIDEKGRVLGRRSVQVADDLPRGNGIGACFMYRRKVHEALSGYDETTFRAEDYDFWFRAWLSGFPMRAVHEDLYLYRVHGASLSAGAGMIEGPSAAERVILRHAPRMEPRDRALALLQVRDLASGRGDDRTAGILLTQAFALSPLITLRRVAGRAVRRVRALFG